MQKTPKFEQALPNTNLLNKIITHFNNRCRHALKFCEFLTFFVAKVLAAYEYHQIPSYEAADLTSTWNCYPSQSDFQSAFEDRILKEPQFAFRSKEDIAECRTALWPLVITALRSLQRLNFVIHTNLLAKPKKSFAKWSCIVLIFMAYKFA